MRQVIFTVTVVLCLLAGCVENQSVEQNAEHKAMKKVILLKDRNSGYPASAVDWQPFLDCWYAAVVQRAAKESSGGEFLTVLSKFTFLSRDPQPSAAETEAEISRLQARLGTNLPRSYTDFVRAYRPPTYRPHEVAGGGVLRVGMYAPKQIGRLAQLEPRLAQESVEIPIESSDAEYYLYGTDQSDVAIRTRYRSDAIVVGSHGPAAYDLIVLYPQEKTRDAEMEAALIFHSGEFRAPSFAELMRQLAYMEAHDVGRVPPYSQSDLAGACSRLLPLTSVWWK